MAFQGLLQGVMQGIGAGAKGGAEVAKGYFEDQRKIDVYKEMADIEQEKMLLIDKIKRNRDIEDIAPKSEAETKAAIAKMSNPEYVKSLEKADIAGVAGDIKLKQTRSADSVASEGVLGKMDSRTKALYQTYAKELDVIGGSIAKAQADDRWNPDSENAKSLLKRQALLNNKIQNLLGGGATGERGSLDDFYPSEPQKSSNTPARPGTSSTTEAPAMDVSTRRVYTTQGKEGAVATLQAKIKQYEDALAANPGEGLDYSKQIQGLKDQISAVQRMK